MKGLIRNPQLLLLTAITLVDSFVLQNTRRRVSWNGVTLLSVHNSNLSKRSCSRKAVATDVQRNRNDDDNDDTRIRERTLNWLNDVVIGMNLCPFADLPMRKKQIQINVIRGTDIEQILEKIWNELSYRVDAPGTTLVVCPELHPDDFDSYLDVLDLVQQILETETYLESQVQVAPFHPLFQFEGSEREDSDNWTNRSPYPIFHILREDEVSRAVEKIGGDAGLVWKRNVELLETMERELGTKALEQIMTSNNMDANLMQQKSNILRRLRIRHATDGNNTVGDDADP